MDAVLAEKKGEVFWITLNRPKKFNATNADLCHGLVAAFDKAEKDETVKLTVLTGNGKCFSAGADLSPDSLKASLVDPDGDVYAVYKHAVDRMIKHSKPLIALVNGDAIGFGTTCLALCDAVFARESAKFWTPFSEIGASPEVCSSYLFPKILGYQKAAQLIMFAEKFTAKEAHEVGLVTKVIPDELYDAEVGKVIEKYSKLAKSSLFIAKRLLRTTVEVDELLAVNIKEHELLMRQFQSEDFRTRVVAKANRAKM